VSINIKGDAHFGEVHFPRRDIESYLVISSDEHMAVVFLVYGGFCQLMGVGSDPGFFQEWHN